MFKENGNKGSVGLSEIRGKLEELDIEIGWKENDLNITGKKKEVFRAVSIIQKARIGMDVRIIVNDTGVSMILTSEKIQAGYWRSVFRKMKSVFEKDDFKLPDFKEGERIVLVFKNTIDKIMFLMRLKRSPIKGFLSNGRNIKIAKYETREEANLCKLFFSVNKETLVYIGIGIRFRSFDSIEKIKNKYFKEREVFL